MTAQIEDPDFKYGGYWRATAAEVIEGDGVRFSDSEPSIIVRSINESADGMVVLLVEDRAAHVANVFADAFGRPIEGMSADPMPAMRVMAPTEPVWIRL